jgi:LEA14-like dessication related protein
LGAVYFLALVAGCAGVSVPEEGNFKDPLIGLDYVEISYYAGYYYFSKDVTPTRGRADNYGAPLLMTFVYKIHNPNSYPIMLDGFSFTVKFEDFRVNNVISPTAMWIPGGKTNLLRVPAMFDTRQTLLALILPEAEKLKSKNISPWIELEKWWTGASDFSYPISVTEGSAVFRAGTVVRAIAFAGHYPRQRKQ